MKTTEQRITGCGTAICADCLSDQATVMAVTLVEAQQRAQVTLQPSIVARFIELFRSRVRTWRWSFRHFRGGL